jgi:HrpA-like RNA helicase
MMNNNKNLPIFEKRKDILEAIRKDKVTIICGDTGCGKTTQIPQYILQDEPQSYILCTQPRRLAAINIAKRVADEMRVSVGDVVGYHVGMQFKWCFKTRVLFMTTGIFLQRLVNDDDFLKKVTHVVLDEVHERDWDIDFAMVILKHILNKSRVKLILMSATINTELFAHYFSKSAIDNIQSEVVYFNEKLKIWKNNEQRGQRVYQANDWGKIYHWEDEKDPWIDEGEDIEGNWGYHKDAKEESMPVSRKTDPAPVISINKHYFQVKVMYLEYVLQGLDQVLRISKTDPIYDWINNFNPAAAALDEQVLRAAALLIVHLIEFENCFKEKPGEKKTILVFMPGLYEINSLIDYIEDEGEKGRNLDLIALHSSLGDDEQDRAFNEPAPNRRKVIIATNIAESSITISDVYYVIDLCLTKEIYYDPVNKNENLQLNWASKASCRQRSGRAGRVRDGFVFRMCPEDFYNYKMLNYPKPEMQRCPLEKLILQIKIWNKFEPTHILGRAIQPPIIRDIGIAIKLLQETGALTIDLKDDSNSGEITELGKIFVNIPVDIKLTRLFLFGLTFRCMSQAIIMGWLHAQPRSLFKNLFRGEGAWKQLETKLEYDKGECSDSILQLKIYEEWWEKFHEEHYEVQYDGDRRIRKPKISKNRDELRWCRERCLDWSILKETLILIEEIRHRFMNMKVLPEIVNSRVKYDENGILILKTILSGAFYRKYIHVEYKNINEREKYMNPGIIPETVADRSLIYNRVPDYIRETHIEMLINKCIEENVYKVLIMYERPIVILEMINDKLKLINALKKWFKIHKRKNQDRGPGKYRQNRDDEQYTTGLTILERNKIMEKKRRATLKKLCKNEDTSSSNEEDDMKEDKEHQLDDQTALKLLEENDLKQPIHLHELRLATFENDVFVDAEPDSINFASFHFNQSTLPSVAFTCQSFYDKGGKFLARNTTQMPPIPMISLLYCLIFSPMVEILPHYSKDYYARIRLENSESNTYKLPFQLTTRDLENIQELRQNINEMLCSQEGIQRPTSHNVGRKLQEVITKERMGVEVLEKIAIMKDDENKYGGLKERIERAFGERFKEEINREIKKEEVTDMDEDEKLDQEIEKKTRVKEGLKEFEEEEDDNEQKDDEAGYGDNSDDISMSNEDDESKDKEEEKEDNPLIAPIPKSKPLKISYFLNDLIYKKLETEELFERGNKDEIEADFKKRYLFRQKIKRELEMRCDLYGLKEWAIVCKKWDSILSYLNNLEVKKESAGICEIRGLLCGLTETRGMTKESMEDPFVKETLTRIKEDEDHDFLVCNYGHLCGLRVKFKYFFTKDSPIEFKFPMGSKRDWELEMWKDQFAEAKQQEAITQKIIDWSNISEEDKKCTICDKQFDSADDLVDHCERDEDHQETWREFLLKTKDFDKLGKK